MTNITTNQKIKPFLWFDGKAEEAVNFYCSVFKNSQVLSLTTGEVTIATFQLAGLEFMALDGGPLFQFTPAISLFVNCDSQEEVDEFWNKLSEGGRTDQCGWLQDRYGLSWQIVPTVLGELMSGSNPVKTQRVFQAMLQMTKLDIQTLLKAYDQE